MPLLLSRAELEPLLDVRGAIAVLEQTYRYQAAGQLDESPPLRLMGRKLRMVAGGLPVEDHIGVRLSAANGPALALLFEQSSGDLLALMNYPFSHLRVAATMGLAIDRLARPDVRSMAMIGSGKLAPPSLLGATSVRHIESIPVFSPTPEHRRAFADRQSARLGIAVRAVDSPREAVDGADIVLVSTNSKETALQGTWLEPGQAVFGCGRPNEFDSRVYLDAGTIVVSSKHHEQNYYDTKLQRPLIELTSSGRIPWSEVAELGEIVAGKVQPKGMTVFRESQGGYSDVALASHAYKRALELGLGTPFDI